MNPQSKNAELLRDFTAYCQKNPELRFWQALRNWSGNLFIYVAKAPIYAVGANGLRDTFYWGGKNG